MGTRAALMLLVGYSLACSPRAKSKETSTLEPGASVMQVRGKPTQSTTIDGLKIELNAPTSVRDAQIRPSSVAHDSRAAAVSVVFRNDSAQPIAVPLDEIGNGLVLVYRVAGRELVDNAIPPPPHDGTVMTIAPDQTHVVRLSLGYPQSLLPNSIVDALTVQFCVRWSQEWLRTKNYRPGTVGWNKSFEVCATVQITPD